jgi:cytochrome c-type biogenesis protein CcmF
MPWLVAAALLHSAIVVEKRSALKSWTILLAILAFSLSLIGTFIVRSGVITSVHAFANDPERGVFILAILAVATVGPLTLFAWRASAMRSEGVFQPLSREGALVLNNLLLVCACAVVFVGTIAPLAREFIDGAKISVGAPFFELTFTPAAWLVLGVIVELVERAGFGRVPVRAALGRLAGLPRADGGKALAHAGLGLSVMGIAAVSAWEVEDIRLARPGEVIPLGPYEVQFDGVEQLPLGADFAAVGCGTTAETVLKGGEPRNFETVFGRFRLLRDGELVAHLCPEKRIYPVQRMPTTEAAIDSGLARDVYLVLGDGNGEGAWAVRSYLKPLANWIWLGALVMAAGGLVSLTDRRFRVGAAARRPAAVPAE